MNCEKCGNPLVEENGIMVCKNCNTNANNTDEVVVSETQVVEISPVVEAGENVTTTAEVVVASAEDIVVKTESENNSVSDTAPVVESPVSDVNVEPVVESTITTETNAEVTGVDSSTNVETNTDVPVVDNNLSASEEVAITNEVSASIDNGVNPQVPQSESQLVDNSATAELPKETKKGGKKGLIIGIVIVLVVVACVLGVGFFFYNKATDTKSIVTSTINKVLATYKETTTEVSKPSKVSFDYSAKVVSEDKDNILAKILNNLALSGDSSIDLNNKLANINMSINYADAPMVNASIYVQDNKAYGYLNGLLDKYLDLGVTEEEINELFETDDKANGSVYKVADTILKTVNNSIGEDEYTQEIVDYTLNGKSTKAVKHSLKINKERFVKLTLDVLNAFNNEDGIKALDEIDAFDVSMYDDLAYGTDALPTDAVPTTESCLKEAIELYSNYDYEKEDNVTIDVEFYTGLISGDFLKVSFKSNVSKYDEWDEKRYNEVTTINISKTTDSTFTYNYKTEDEEYESTSEYSGNLKVDESNNTFVFDISIDSSDSTSSKESSSSTLITVSGGNNKIDIKAYVEDGEETIELTVGLKVENIEKIEKKDIQNAVLMSEMSEDDQAKLTQNLEGNVAFKAFSDDLTKLISSIFGSFSLDTTFIN